METLLTRVFFVLGFFRFFDEVDEVVRLSGRSLSLLDPTYAKTHMPIIASVSEHQPAARPPRFKRFKNHDRVVYSID